MIKMTIALTPISGTASTTFRFQQPNIWDAPRSPISSKNLRNLMLHLHYWHSKLHRAVPVQAFKQCSEGHQLFVMTTEAFTYI